MINSNKIIRPDERLNLILDKISDVGIKGLNKDEVAYLESYSRGKEKELNEKLSEEENSKTFISDDGIFTFRLKGVELIDGVKFINGLLKVPDIKTQKCKIIKGELYGSIILFDKNNVAIDFRRGKYDVFEFVNGIEYELDCFVDDIILKIKEEEKKEN